jgi:hypothetical protein
MVPAGATPSEMAGTRRAGGDSPWNSKQGLSVCVCFFVSCNRRWFNRVPVTNLQIACLPVPPNSDAGYADLPLTLLGAPVNNGVPGSQSLGVPGSRSLGVAKTGPRRQ